MPKIPSLPKALKNIRPRTIAVSHLDKSKTKPLCRAFFNLARVSWLPTARRVISIIAFNPSGLEIALVMGPMLKIFGSRLFIRAPIKRGTIIVAAGIFF